MTWRPTASLATLRLRARLLAATRDFFAARGLLEVETPALAPTAVTDPHLASIEAVLASGRRLHLHTSPEFHMKRLLAAGAPDVWQLCKVYRDGEAGRRHQPEFTLLEWYRHGLDLAGMATETCELLLHLARAAEAAGAAPVLTGRPPVQTTYRVAFEDAVGLDPLVAPLPELRARAATLLGPALDADLCAGLGEERSLWLDLLMSHAVSTSLATEPLVVVAGYPADQAALARLDPADPRVAERFEVFCRGVEVANGYRELTDAAEQARRFSADREVRRRLGRPDVEPDPALLAALRHGLPECAGVAVGFDRVVMLLLGLPDLGSAVSFRLPGP